MNILLAKSLPLETAELIEFFQSRGNSVYIANDSKAVYMMLSLYSIDLVYFDARMIEDFNLIAYINQYYPDTKVIVSSEASLCNAVTNVREGIFSTLKRPFHLKQLNNLVQEIVDHKQNTYKK